MRSRLVVLCLVCGLLLGSVSTVSADATAFLGITSTPQNHGLRGFALGFGLVDYRIFRLQGEPLHQTYQRFYAGANLAF
jgi:hypothetical protein